MALLSLDAVECHEAKKDTMEKWRAAEAANELKLVKLAHDFLRRTGLIQMCCCGSAHVGNCFSQENLWLFFSEE